MFVQVSEIKITFQLLSREGKPAKGAKGVTVKSNGVDKTASLANVGNGVFGFTHQVGNGLNSVDVKIGSASVAGFPLEFQRASVETEVAAVKASRKAEQDIVEKEELEKLVHDKVAEKKAAAEKVKVAAEVSAKAAQERAVAAAQKKPEASKTAGVRSVFETKPPAPVSTGAAPALQRASSSKGSITANFLANAKPEPAKTAEPARPGPAGPAKNKLTSVWEQKIQAEKK